MDRVEFVQFIIFRRTPRVGTPNPEVAFIRVCIFAHYVSREKARLFYFEKLGCDLGSGKNKLHQRVKGVTPFCG